MLWDFSLPLRRCLRTTAFWDTASCTLVEAGRRFRRAPILVIEAVSAYEKISLKLRTFQRCLLPTSSWWLRLWAHLKRIMKLTDVLEVLTAYVVLMADAVSTSETYRKVGGRAYCLHRPGDWGSKISASIVFLIEAVSTSETSFYFYETTRSDVSEGWLLQWLCCYLWYQRCGAPL
jgi:hypothetical protein